MAPTQGDSIAPNFYEKRKLGLSVWQSDIYLDMFVSLERPKGQRTRFDYDYLRCVWINILFRFGMAYQIPRARLLVNINLIKKKPFFTSWLSSRQVLAASDILLLRGMNNKDPELWFVIILIHPPTRNCQNIWLFTHCKKKRIKKKESKSVIEVGLRSEGGPPFSRKSDQNSNTPYSLVKVHGVLSESHQGQGRDTGLRQKERDRIRRFCRRIENDTII